MTQETNLAADLWTLADLLRGNFKQSQYGDESPARRGRGGAQAGGDGGAKLAHALQAEATKKDAEIQALQAKLDASETARQLAVTVAVNEAVGVVARERDDLKNDLNLIAVKNQL
ncbi:MAG: hypothetical protein NT095_10795 [Burkholderiales bacterium]|nr:hypothetical protein [Burkholderiales bacterium]